MQSSIQRLWKTRQDDAAIHASQSGGYRGSYSAPRCVENACHVRRRRQPVSHRRENFGTRIGGRQHSLLAACWQRDLPSPREDHSVERVRWWRRRESNPRPKARRRRTLHACPLLDSRARREEAAKNRRAPDPETSRGRTPGRRPTASLFNGIWPPTTRRGRGRRSQLN